MSRFWCLVRLKRVWFSIPHVSLSEFSTRFRHSKNWKSIPYCSSVLSVSIKCSGQCTFIFRLRSDRQGSNSTDFSPAKSEENCHEPTLVCFPIIPTHARPLPRSSWIVEQISSWCERLAQMA
mmetsp:Transcript_7116/g.11318  ORF Transcript_7116/g.11318 Transcript_7116/m.11318 type:complete len:122 (+) Transcript_7116:1648-2013(+)